MNETPSSPVQDDNISKTIFVGKGKLMKSFSWVLLFLLPWLFFACEKQSGKEQAGQEAHLVSEEDPPAVNAFTSAADTPTSAGRLICVFPLQKQPEFPGGDSALAEYLKENVKYPKQAVRQKAEGMVVAHFQVSATGKVGDIQIVKSVRKDLDSAFFEALEKMPLWKPSTTEKGVPQATYYVLPLWFRL